MWRFHKFNFGLSIIYFLLEVEHDQCTVEHNTTVFHINDKNKNVLN